MVIATPKRNTKTTGNKVLYVPNPVSPNSSYKQIGKSPEQQKIDNPVTSKLGKNNPSNIAQTQKIEKISTLNLGRAKLNSGLSQNIYDAGGIDNYLTKTTGNPSTVSKKLPTTNTAKSKFDQGFTLESKSLGYKSTGTMEIARKIEAKNIGNPSYTPELKSEINRSIEKNPEWFDPNSQIVQNNQARVNQSNAEYIKKVNYKPPVVLSFEGTRVQLTPDQSERYKKGELNTKFAVLRPNGEITFAKNTKSAEKLRANQYMSFPKPEGFGIVPESSKSKSITKQTKNNINELMPFTTFESLGAKNLTQQKSPKVKSQYIEPVEKALGFQELKPNQNVSFGEKALTGLGLGAAAEFESFGNIGATGERLATGKNELFGEFKERDASGQIAINAGANALFGGAIEVGKGLFGLETQENTRKNLNELGYNTGKSLRKSYDLFLEDPVVQAGTFVAPIVSFIPATALKTGKFALQGLSKGLSKVTPQAVQNVGKKSAQSIISTGGKGKDKFLDAIQINYGTGSKLVTDTKSPLYGTIQPIIKSGKNTGRQGKNKNAPIDTGIFIQTTPKGKKMAENAARQATPLSEAINDIGVTPQSSKGSSYIDDIISSGRKVTKEDYAKAKTLDKIERDRAEKLALANEPFARSPDSITGSELSINLERVAKGELSSDVLQLRRSIGKKYMTQITEDDAQKLIQNDIGVDDFGKYIYPKSLDKKSKSYSNIIDEYVGTKPNKNNMDEFGRTTEEALRDDIVIFPKNKANEMDFSDFIQSGKKETNKQKAIRKYGSESGVQDTSSRGGNLITELFENPKGKVSSALDDTSPFVKFTKSGGKKIRNNALPLGVAASASAGYSLSNILEPPKQQTENKKLQKDKNKDILAFQGDYLLGYREDLEKQKAKEKRTNPIPFAFAQTPYLEQDEILDVDQVQSPYLKEQQIFDNPFPPYSPEEEAPIQTPFLEQVPFRVRSPKAGFEFTPQGFTLFGNPFSSSSKDEVNDSDFFRVFASAKEPFGSTELPLGEFVDSSSPIFEIKDRLTGSQIRKQNRFGGLQNPLRAPKNIIDEDNFANLFGYGQPKKGRKTKERSIFDIF